MPDKDVVKKRDRDEILEMKDDEIISLVNVDFAIAEADRIETTARNRRYRKIYFQKENLTKTDKKTSEGPKDTKRAANYLPLGRVFCDTAKDMVAGSVFSQDPPVKIEPTEDEDQKRSVEFEHLFAYRARSGQMNLKAKFEDEFIFQACLYDHVVGRLGWLTKRAYVPHVEEKKSLLDLGFLRWPRTQMKVTMIPKLDAIDRPDFEVLNTLLSYPDPRATDFPNSRYYIYLQDTNKSEMRKLAKTKDNRFGVYDNVEKIESNSYPGLKVEQQTQGRDDQEKPSEEDLVQLKNYYTPDAMVQIANDKWVVRKRSMPGFPFTKGAYCQPDHQWAGIGLMEGIEMLQIDANQLIRLRRDNINYIVNSIAIINKGMFGMLKHRDWRMWPGKTFVINQGDPTKAIHFARPPDTTQNIFQDINFNINMIERTTRISQNAQAVRAQGRRTATEAGLVAEGMEVSIGGVASRFEERNLVDIVNMDYNLELQHLTEQMKYRILGPKGYEFKVVGRGDILHKGAFDVRPVGTKFAMNKQLKNSQWLHWAQMVSANPMFAQATEVQEVLREGWSRSGEQDPERFIKDLSDTDYMIPPKMENEMFLARGQSLKPGNRDNDDEHIASHTEFRDTGAYPHQFTPLFDEHIEMHEARKQQAESMKSGQGNIPQSPENVMGQGFQNFGGPRIPGGGEGGTPSPDEATAPAGGGGF